MCLGGGGGYIPPQPKKAPEAQPGPESPPDMINNQVIPNAHDSAVQEAARNEMDPPNKTKLKSQSSKYN